MTVSPLLRALAAGTIETDWRACSGPQAMLDRLRGKASDRKLRLFAVACCRHVWPLLAGGSPDHGPLLLAHERRVVELAEPNLDLAERFADGLLDEAEIMKAYSNVNGLLSSRRPELEPWAFALVALLRAATTGACNYGQDWESAESDGLDCAKDAAEYAASVAAWATADADDAKALEHVEAGFVRCIFGRPGCRPTISPACLAWNDGTVVKLAQAIYDERQLPSGHLDSGRMAILADALEDAGCADAELLGHLRGPGPHVRGCHVLDALLGKE